MERDIKRAKGADEQPIGTRKESILGDARIEHLEEEIRTKDALIAKLTKENEDLQQKLGLLSRGPVKKGAQTRYWRREEHERFLEALEKYGQRDVKNISAYVGTRSPTQVRTHAQKYFLKQRREETAQMKNANTMARKRRLINAAAGGSASGNGSGSGLDDMMDEEEDEEDDEEDDMEEDDMLEEDEEPIPIASTSSSMQVDHHHQDTASSAADDSNGGVPRRKSTRVTNAQAVIKSRTQDIPTHHSSPSNTSGSRGGTGKRTTASHSTSAASALVSSLASANGTYSSSTSPAPTNTKGKATSATSTASTASATAAAISASTANRKQAVANSPPPTTSNSSPAPYTNTSPYNTLPGGSAMMNAANVKVAAGGASRGPSISAQGGYSVPSVYGAYGAPAPYGVPHIFNSPEEAAQFYKAVKVYERETDRTKVLHSIKDYFLPHRSVEEISTMVDLAFPTFDPNSGYGAAAAAAAAFHPMYAAQSRMYYPDGHGQLAAGFGAGQHSSGTVGGPNAIPPNQAAAVAAAIAAAQANPPKLGEKLGGAQNSASNNAASYLQSNHALLAGYPGGFPGMDASEGGSIDFGPTPTHIDASSMAAITERMSQAQMVKMEESASQTGTSSSSIQQRQSISSTAPGSEHSATSSPSVTTSNPGDANSGTKKKEDDDDLMSELASLTDRSIAGGGLSNFLGGRPLALSPGVFGSGTGSTPLGFGMTPLGLANSTPLSFMSPLGLNFATQSPINPYFNPQK